MSEVLSTDPAPASATPASQPSVEVFAVYGVEPEIQAYAMAKYSRSSLSMKESLKEITSQKAEKFLNTFYFQYGHRSIADLAHIALAIERLSILAAIVVADEQRWDGQERSTRYQDFRKSGYYTPSFQGDAAANALYRDTIESLFAAYEKISQRTFEYLASITPRPAEMKPDAYERTLRARAFDISRYLLPLSTNTSLGEIVNARTLETQVAHLLSQPHQEIRDLGGLLKQAALSPAYNANEESLRALVVAIRAVSPELAERAERELLREVRVAPTLVKYADPNRYEIVTCLELQQAAEELMRGAAIEPAPLVDLIDNDLSGGDSLEIELAATLIYGHCHYSYRQLRRVIAAAGEVRRREIVDLGLRHRGKHDELLRAFSAGQQFRFDILMDIGGFRDMHRHRRCVQIMQDFTTIHGFDTPPEVEAAGVRSDYESAMKRAAGAIERLAASGGDEAAQSAQYAIPLAFRKRTLFKMDFAEAVYISELRTTPAGHSSYRNVAYAMYEAVAAKHPALAKYFRVHDIREPVDLLKR
ncbi:MAG TPA: FAD-dependent thymidylate synthase [Terriglobales bacterium]|jgi:thymidylate synthase ThyX|nr:FAD-dependent thymidylate synthase [Terriglobales bacterium]